jgi:hypothetical protein
MTWPLRQAFRFHFLHKVALINAKAAIILKPGILMAAKNLPQKFYIVFMMLLKRMVLNALFALWAASQCVSKIYF